MENKQSDLTFQDFLGSGHKYNHNATSKWEAVGASIEDVKTLQDKMCASFEKYSGQAISLAVEECIAIDLPAPLKALGFMQMGKNIFKSELQEIIESAPDEIPVPLLKHLLLLAFKLS